MRLPGVKQREVLFQAGLPILCKYHGEHLEWVRHAARTQNFSVVCCKICLRDRTKLWVKRNYLHALAMWTKRRDANTEITEVFLQKLFIKQKGRCALTGTVFDEIYKPSVDRIDSSVGYLQTNVQLVLNEINKMKTNLPLDVFLIRCKQVANHALDSTAS